MGWFSNKRDNQNAVAAAATAAVNAVPFHEKMEQWIDGLDWYERECSGYVSPEAFSILRRMNDKFNEIAFFLRSYQVRAEEEYVLESTLRKYIPETLVIFNQLPEEERMDGGDADKQLIQQFNTMFDNIKNLNQQMHENVKKDLRQQTAFVEDRFANMP